MKKVLVTGATGFIGYEVSRQLSAMGLQPRLLVRRPNRAAILAPLEAELVQGDLTSRKSLDRAVDGVDTIIHLAARATFERYATLRPTIVDGSKNLIESARAAGVETFVYASSLFVYGNQNSPIDVNTPLSPQLGYGKAKVEAEKILIEIAADANMSLALIRLPHVYGAQDLLFGQIHKGFTVLPGNGENLYAHLHVEDAARVLIAAAKNKWTGASAVADCQAVTWNEFFAVVRDYYPRFRLIKIPQAMAELGALALVPILRIRSAPSLLTTGSIKGYNLNLPVSPNLLWSDLRLNPKFPTIHQGIPAVLNDCIRFRWRHPLSDHTS